MTCVGQIVSATSETPVPVFSMATGIYTTSNPVSGLPIQTFPTGYLVGNAPNSIQIQHPGQFEVIDYNFPNLSIFIIFVQDMNYLGPSPASTVAEQLIASSEAVALSNDLSHINLLPIVGSTSISSQLGPSRTQTSVTLSADSLVDHSSTLESFSSAGAPSVANITPVMLYAGQLEQISGSTINSTELVSSVNGTTMMEGPGRRNRIGAGHIPQTSHDSSGGPQYPITPCSSEPGRRIETHEPDDAGESRKQSVPPTSIRSNKKKGSGAILLDKGELLDTKLFSRFDYNSGIVSSQ
ncbi:unnamed protein product [Protopolystoma xenopodis]|uniref:Uncharacterized protein n=1 Tax=Protopolystoma xenopodis TaxID=117903 RepID=A0A3S5ABG4_9PLAT|nr:unnamed protein product [Protopolystoma xenopodis]